MTDRMTDADFSALQEALIMLDQIGVTATSLLLMRADFNALSAVVFAREALALRAERDGLGAENARLRDPRQPAVPARLRSGMLVRAGRPLPC